ncbi:hypothetical protein MHU86_21746 [Fragilaria crotonensis]|nr:hypothetical protein MHU86_21746 [Fragilaria crotonensis]
MEAQRNKDDDDSWNEVSAVNGVSMESTSFDFGGSFDSDEDNHHLAPIALKLRLTNDDPTIPSSEADVAVSMDFETLLGIEAEAVTVPCQVVFGQAESISGDWMDTSMTAEAWERVREEEAADAASMRQPIGMP